MLRLEDLASLFERHREAATCQVKEFAVGGRQFEFNRRAAVMGVVNLSPDSWYRESVSGSSEAAIQRGRILHAQGADIVDVGAESTILDATRVDGNQQQTRLLPVVEGLSRDHIPVSVETYEPAVAEACLQRGAAVLNLTGHAEDDRMFSLVAEHNAALILCYVQGDNVREVRDFEFGADPTDLMYEYFARRLERAEQRGVAKLFIDPGLGFYYRNLADSAVRVRHQMQVFLNTFRLRKLGFPVCHALPHAFEYFRDEVRCAEPFFAVLAALGKTDLLRTHEVPRIRAVLDTMEVYR